MVGCVRLPAPTHMSSESLPAKRRKRVRRETFVYSAVSCGRVACVGTNTYAHTNTHPHTQMYADTPSEDGASRTLPDPENREPESASGLPKKYISAISCRARRAIAPYKWVGPIARHCGANAQAHGLTSPPPPRVPVCRLVAAAAAGIVTEHAGTLSRCERPDPKRCSLRLLVVQLCVRC